MNMVVEEIGMRKGLEQLLGEGLLGQLNEEIRVLDWVQLFVKLRSKLLDDGWKSILNFLNLGRSGVSVLQAARPRSSGKEIAPQACSFG